MTWTWMPNQADQDEGGHIKADIDVHNGHTNFHETEFVFAEVTCQA
jgi:hypothetical protein